MVLARKYRRSSEVVGATRPVPYQDKWTKMLSQREKYRHAPQQQPEEDSPPIRKNVVHLERQHLIFSIPLSSPSVSTNEYHDESKQESLDDDDKEPVVVKTKKILPPRPPSPIRQPKPSLPKVVVKPVVQARQEEKVVVLKREQPVQEELRVIPQIATIAALGPKPVQEELRVIPQIATIAALGPKINPKLCPPPQVTNKRRRSSTELPDWWKKCVQEDREKQQLRRATWHAPKRRESKKVVQTRRRSFLQKEVSSASLLSGVFSAPIAESRRHSAPSRQMMVENSRHSSLSKQVSFGSISTHLTDTSDPALSEPKPKEEHEQEEQSPIARRASAVSLIKGIIPLIEEAEEEEVEESETSVAIESKEDAPVPRSVEVPKKTESQELESIVEEPDEISDIKMEVQEKEEPLLLIVKGGTPIELAPLLTSFVSILGALMLAMAIGMDLTSLMMMKVF